MIQSKVSIFDRDLCSNSGEVSRNKPLLREHCGLSTTARLNIHLYQSSHVNNIEMRQLFGTALGLITSLTSEWIRKPRDPKFDTKQNTKNTTKLYTNITGIYGLSTFFLKHLKSDNKRSYYCRVQYHRYIRFQLCRYSHYRPYTVLYTGTIRTKLRKKITNCR